MYFFTLPKSEKHLIPKAWIVIANFYVFALMIKLLTFSLDPEIQIKLSHASIALTYLALIGTFLYEFANPKILDDALKHSEIVLKLQCIEGWKELSYEKKTQMLDNLETNQAFKLLNTVVPVDFFLPVHAAFLISLSLLISIFDYPLNSSSIQAMLYCYPLLCLVSKASNTLNMKWKMARSMINQSTL